MLLRDVWMYPCYYFIQVLLLTECESFKFNLFKFLGRTLSRRTKNTESHPLRNLQITLTAICYEKNRNNMILFILTFQSFHHTCMAHWIYKNDPFKFKITHSMDKHGGVVVLRYFAYVFQIDPDFVNVK